MATLSDRSKRHTTLLLALLWMAFLVRGSWYCALLSPWEGYDEPFHFAALQHVATGQGMPRADSPISLEVQKSLHLLPLPWQLHLHEIPGPLTPHDEFWKLPPDQREAGIAAVRAIPPEEGWQPGSEPIANYEFQQAPLYYWIVSLPLRAVSPLPLLSRIYVLRFASLLLASLVIPMSYWIARYVLQSDLKAIGVIAVIVLLPELMINLARVANDSLALVCYTALLAAALMVVHKPFRWCGWLLLGTTLGFGLLAKAYVLSALPAMAVVGALAAWVSVGAGKARYSSVLARLGTALAVAALIAGRWYLRLHATTHSWTGVKDDIAIGNLSVIQKVGQVAHVNWRSGVLSILISHVWFGAWSFLRIPNAVCVLAFAVIALAVAGVLVRLRRPQTPSSEKNDIFVLAAFYLCFWAGLLYDVLVNFLTHGASASAGWYLYATVAAEIVLLAWGLQAFMSARVLFPSLAVCLAALDLYGTHALLMPYYTGLTSHVGNWVPAALGTTLAQLPLVFMRLAELRPGWLNGSALWVGWASYWMATIGTVLAVVICFRKSAGDASLFESKPSSRSSQ